MDTNQDPIAQFSNPRQRSDGRFREFAEPERRASAASADRKPAEKE